jgi:SagB-type dehydrogenase family enzyme
MKTSKISVTDYHQRSKHRLQQYANGPDGLDWASQANPFREFTGCLQIALPLATQQFNTRFADLYQRNTVPSATPDAQTIGALFELAMGLSAWKVSGHTRWALRNNPSSGNLHPTESYLITTGINNIAAGVYHYHSYLHCLEQRCAFATAPPADSLLIGLSSIHWREAWKYGERAYRYCQHDVGHAIAAFSYAAATLGWQVEVLAPCSDQHINTLLGLNRSDDFNNAEHETADVLLHIHSRAEHTPVNIDELASRAQQGNWHGQANCLSPQSHIDWPVIDDISHTCIKPQTNSERWHPPQLPDLISCPSTAQASSIIQQRRSAQAFDGISTLPLENFYRMLDCVLPRQNTPPFDSLLCAPRIHLVIFVHRVAGLESGLYVLARSANGEKNLRENLSADFDWIKADTTAEHLALYQLASGNSQNAARVISCHQEIAADSVFSLGMLAEFDSNIEHTPWQYRQLFWEAGIIGQALYLEAEAANVRATGIGCYFDDSLHEMLGIENTSLQSMYHFTVGTAIMDERLVTEPAYIHLKNRN